MKPNIRKYFFLIIYILLLSRNHTYRKCSLQKKNQILIENMLAYEIAPVAFFFVNFNYFMC